MANVEATAPEAGSTGSDALVKPKRGPRIDLATLLGTLGAFAMIGLAMVLGGSPESFFNLPSVLLVIAGTFMVTTISFTLGEVWQAQRVMLRAVLYHVETPGNAATQVLYMAALVRQKGKLALDRITFDASTDRFLKQAVNLVVDGLPTDEVERNLNRESEATHKRHQRSAAVLRRAGEVAPAMGLIGTLVGLVQMLGQLDDPSAIGPAMAIALLTTFYGAVLSNMVFMPLAAKLERNSQAESLVNQIYTIGAVSISRQENPRRLEMLINTILSPRERIDQFD